MAKFTRADIRRIVGDNCTDEIENSLIALHLGVVDALKDDVARYKADADKLADVTKERDDLKAAMDSGDDYKSKYDDLKKTFDAYKKDAQNKAEKETKTAAFRELLVKAGINEKRIDTVLKVSDIDGVKLNDKGEIDGADKLVESLKTEWADFVTSTDTVPVKTPTPPANNGNKTVKTRADVYAVDEHGRFVLDANERQAELAKIIATEQKG